MNTQHQSNRKTEIYSISGFKDTLASPVFYPVLVVTLVLGVTSILGFIQNPLKLKTVVNVIQQKVATNNVVDDIFKVYQSINSNSDSQSYSKDTTFNAAHTQINHTFDLFPDIETSHNEKMTVVGNFERIAFNYDVTSESFWTDLDSSRLETASEEMERKERESTTFGAPLRIDYREDSTSDFNIENDSIYALKALNRL